MKNNLAGESSPYLLQHAQNPVHWFPWCDEAFSKAEREGKPIFLSIGYSACHWCHVMAHETFESAAVADILNESFVSIKVDREERPDIDAIYMSACQAFTGEGGWPMTVFATPDQKPFFTGTYFPRDVFVKLISTVRSSWQENKGGLIKAAQEIVDALKKDVPSRSAPKIDLIKRAVTQFEHSFDSKNGGFGGAPKFPMAHNLLFLLNHFKETGHAPSLEIAEKTLMQMYKGGIFDHVGFGFSRYSTDETFLVPHFEKMLYDNALLILGYVEAYKITKKEVYSKIAQKTAEFLLRDLRGAKGEFFSALDADSDGVEGKFYVFSCDEIIELLGKTEGEKFNRLYGISQNGNFEEKNIANLLRNEQNEEADANILAKVYEYRKSRAALHLDDKVLTAWNSLAVCAFAELYSVFADVRYLEIAEKTCRFIEKNLVQGDTVYVSYRDGKRGAKGFCDDYAFYILAQIAMYEACGEKKYLERAIELNDVAVREFADEQNGGFYLYGSRNEQLILRPKLTHDGAIPSGNSVMAYNLVKLASITKSDKVRKLAAAQLEFMEAHASRYPSGNCFYLLALGNMQKVK